MSTDEALRRSIETRIAAEQAKREAAGLHVHWRLPDGSLWSAYALDDVQKARWIESKAKLGWTYLP